jgi:hypothetical protein
MFPLIVDRYGALVYKSSDNNYIWDGNQEEEYFLPEPIGIF